MATNKVTAADIIARAAARAEERDTVDMPEWGCSVLIRRASTQEILNMDTDKTAVEGTKDLLALCIVEPEFTREEIDSLFAFESQGPLLRLAERIRIYNKLNTPVEVEAHPFPVQPAGSGELEQVQPVRPGA